MDDFLTLVWGDSTGYVCITTNDLDGNPTHDKFFEYPEQLDKLIRHVELHAVNDVYFSPAIFKTKNSRKKSNIKHFTTLFADTDTFDVEDYYLEPTIQVHTSPGKTHCYWVLDNAEEYSVGELEQYNHAVSEAHPKNETGHDTGWAANKLLRVPGTTNRKYAKPHHVWEEINGTVYTVEEFSEAYPTDITADITGYEFKGLQDVEIPDEVTNISLDSEAVEVINTQFEEGARSEPLFLSINNCFEAGATDEQTFFILHNTPVDKWSDKFDEPKASEYLWDDIQRTRLKKLPDPTRQQVKDVDLGEKSSFEFLSSAERENLHDSFVDRFVSWSDKKTNAARDYKEAAAFIILSTVFSDFGHINMQWGQEPLNLWFIISGGTTVDRKSTSKNQALKFLRQLEHATEEGVIDDETEYIYDYSSDFSVEGMADVLLKRPHRSGVVTRDEFQGFLAEINQKQYKSGMKETLTDWYGGWVSSRIRSGNSTKKSGVPFALSFYAIGIDDQIVDKLTTDDFASGFLPRFLWVDPTESVSQTNSITDGFKQASGDVQADEELFELVETVRNAREFWESFVDPEGITSGIHFSDEAWNRIVKYMRDMEKISSPQAIPSVERLSVATLKCAALLAMVDGKDNIGVEYVIKAIQYSSKWYNNMVNKLNAVSDTIWKKQQDEILKSIVESGGSIPLKSIYSKVRAQYTSKEFAEILKALEDSGYIKQENTGGVVKLIFTGA